MHVLIHFNVTNEKLMLVGCVEIQEAIFLETSLLEYSVHDGFPLSTLGYIQIFIQMSLFISY